MNNIDHLKKALEATLSQLSQKKTESSNGKLISSWNDEYNYGGINIFETSFVDALVSNLAVIQAVGSIGWEVNYPWNESDDIWYRKKLDLAIGYIPRDKEPNSDRLQALFQMPIEVKKLPVDENGDFTVESEMYIWQDIFKLYGYKFTDDSGNKDLREEVGKEKIMLCFSEVENGAIFEFKKNIKERFVEKIRLNKKQTFNGRWFSNKDFEKIEQENQSGEKRDFDLDYLLEKFLYWSNPKDRKYLIETCGLSLNKKKIVKSCEFITHKLSNSETTLVATILHLN